jgi:molecular chaperone DnaJ
MQDVEFRPGTQPGDVVTLRGLGVTHLQRGGRGDLRVHANVTTPTHLTEEQEHLLREFAAMRGEDRPDGRLHPVDKGLFGKLRDALKGE